MLQNCIRAENRKLHASPIWIMFFLLPVISAGYGTFNYLQNLEILTDGWYSLWTQHTLFYSMFFFPAMVAAYAAYLWRLEHLGHNWNFIMATPVHPLALFAAKFVVVGKLALLTHAFVFVLYAFCGKVFARLPGTPPLVLALFLLRGALGALAVIAAQLVLAMVIRSFAAVSYTHLTLPTTSRVGSEMCIRDRLCGAHLSGIAWRHHRHFCRCQGLRPAVALRPDAGRHERQP